ncbi:uncharacterized protein OCT59_020209 [Rhizophagus irregularis]|uniref:uncharacterized protein n=1 Tax=Rhizophagus irregularis TaxID=588596 RepID=UPI00331C2987|nr:hypothetical protein OCT59_020209 [Rhizophagus irregularis]
MRRRYSHNKPIEPIRIRNQFSYSKPNETTDSDERVAIRSPVRSPDNDNDDMDFQYDHKDDLSFQDINDDDNAYGSINPQDYNDEMIFSQDNVNSSDTEEEEESDNEYNYEEEEEEEDNNENNDEEEEEEGNNDDNNNQVEEERNNDEEERNNEEEEIDQIVKALDEDKIPFCNGEFAPYFNNYTTTALFCWLQKHNVSTKAYEDLVDIIHNSQFEPTHVVKNIRRFQSWRKRLPLLPIITKSIKISPKKTPSTSRGSKLSYQLSISEIIWLLYRSGDFVYYHDDNDQKKLGRLRSILKNDDGYYQLRIQKILEYRDLPRNLKGLPRQRRSITGEVWLQDEPFLIIMTSQILEKVTILMMFQHQNIPDEMKELEKGKVMTVQGQDAWIIAGLGVVTADLPQGNDLTGVLRSHIHGINMETLLLKK